MAQNRRLRILQVNKAYWPLIGGVEKGVQLRAEGLKARGMHLRILACRETAGPTIVRRVNGIAVIYAGSYGTVMSLPISFSFFFLLWKLSRKADIVHWHEPFPLATLGVLFVSSKRVITYHSDIVRQKLFRNLVEPLQRLALRRADAVVATSPNLIPDSSVLSRLGRPVVPIPGGIPLAGPTAPAVREEWERRHGHLRPFVLAVGRLVYDKGFDVLIEAAAQSSWPVVILGRGPLEQSLRELAAARGCADCVTFITERVSDEELSCWFEECRIFAFPSTARSEALGLVQIEAMAAGKPVVNTNLPTGVPFVSLHEVTGFTVPVGDAKAFADAVTRLWTDDGLRARYGLAARARAEAEFTQDAMVSRYEVLYRRIMGQEPKVPESKT